MILVAGLFTGLGNFSLRAVNVTLAWDPSPDQGVAGYNVYHGQVSRGYNNVQGANSTTATVSNLVAGATYYFAVTAKSSSGLESDYSTEISYTVPAGPVNQPPTLDAITGLSITEDAAAQVVDLTGITSGSPTENQTLRVTAFSSNPGLVPNPAITYSSPNPNGLLTLTPVPNASGDATITVMVDDGGTSNNTVIRPFIVNVTPVNDPPTLDAINNLSLEANAGIQRVNLSGITAGPTNEVQTLTVSAVSSKPDLTGTPTINYTSPSRTGALEFTPVANASGSATITVTVRDNQAANNAVSRSFDVAITQGVPVVVPIAYGVVAPYSVYRYVFNDPLSNGHPFTVSLEPGAPEGVKVGKRKNVRSLVWVPTCENASTTNLITVRVTDDTASALSTNLTLQVVVSDYVAAIPGRIAVEAGQTGSLPLYAHTSDPLTNLLFTLPWPSSSFGSPTLSVASPSTTAGTLTTQGTNLLIRIRALSGQTITGSNLVARLSFPAASTQPSAFIGLATRAVSATRPGGVAFLNAFSAPGEVVVVKDTPLIRSTVVSNNRVLQVYGRVGRTYQVQSTTSLDSKPTWQPVTTYATTNVSQTINVGSASPLIFYRLQQQ